MTSRYRLRSSAFVRAEETAREEPKKICVLSVEGDETERTYFECLNHCQRMGLLETPYLFRIEVLRHKRGDGYSSPEAVVELLNEYANLENGELLPNDLPEEFTKKYSREAVRELLQMEEFPLEFQEELLATGIDVNYRRYLQSFEGSTDIYAVVLDRDSKSHSREMMERCISVCMDKGFDCYLTNPCFEFWLLLHLCDVKQEYEDAKEDLLKNDRISARHTYVSREVSKRAHHRKSISLKCFQTTYLPKLSDAMAHSRKFASEPAQLLDQLGSNLPDLFDKLGFSNIDGGGTS